MTVLVEKYIELPYDYASDEDALEYVETLMQLEERQAVCDVLALGSNGAEIDCPPGLTELYFDDDLQVILFKVRKTQIEDYVDYIIPDPKPVVLGEDGEPLPEEYEPPVAVAQTREVAYEQLRAASFLPAGVEDA